MPYVDAPKTQFKVGEINPKILIVASEANNEIIDELVSGTIDGLIKSGVLATNIVVEKTPQPEDIPAAIKTIISSNITTSSPLTRIYTNPIAECSYDAVVAIGALIEDQVDGDFDALSMNSYNEVLDLVVATQVPIIMGILTCRDYEQGLERAGIGRVVKGANHGYFWATAALSEIQVRSMYCKNLSDTSIFDSFNKDVSSTTAADSSLAAISKNKKVAIVCAQWNMEINSEIVLKLIDLLVSSGYSSYDSIFVYSAAGSFELPGIASYLAAMSSSGLPLLDNRKSSKFDSIFCVGSLIQGGTKHFKFIGDSVDISIQKICTLFNIKCVSGVLICTSLDEAKYHAGISVGDKPGNNIAINLFDQIN
ncbi:6,7-dimethyl-8-ribityllumazine synthase [Smittium culicis]|uniref:6,7-dimethyl-8-ribityllumazine synthase n=1 Tax=Smittium culicis TaxID=133412 RepID=A0A1R1YU39_9FUNG|nr:6,7-dimethyl-8-ribityllumazine synthase [Smittium culicis]